MSTTEEDLEQTLNRASIIAANDIAALDATGQEVQRLAVLLLSTSTALREMKEALKECAAPFLSKGDSMLADEFIRRMNIAHEALTAIDRDKP